MSFRLTAAALVALAPMLAGCGSVELFGRYDLPESEGVAEAPFPRLVDVPEAPPAGTYDADMPDPAEGQAVVDTLRPEAAVQAVRAEALAAPVLSEEDRRRLGR
ncbi:MAG: hypothetical protein AAFV86_04700 [Pseudomonadota bacterium]